MPPTYELGAFANGHGFFPLRVQGITQIAWKVTKLEEREDTRCFVSFPVKLDISNFFPEGLFLGFFNTDFRMRMLTIITMQNLKLQG